MTEDEKLDALDWLEQAARLNVSPEAAHIVEMLRAAETRENTVLGMCMAQRPHAEIRDCIMSGALAAVSE